MTLFKGTSNLLIAQVEATVEKQVARFSLAEAQEYAVKNFKDAKNAALDKQITRNQTIEIITEGLPQLSGTFNYQHNYRLQTNVIPPGIFGPNELRVQFGMPYLANAYLNIDQLIIDGRYFLGLKANRAFVELTDKQAALTLVDIKVNVAKAYYACLLNIQIEKILKNNLEIAVTLLKETEAYYNAGLREELDVDKLRLNVSQIMSQIELAKYRTTTSFHTLKYLMGLTLDMDIELTDRLEDLLNTEEAITDVQDFNPQSRLEYKLLQTQHEIRGYDKKRFALGYMPALYGNFIYGANTFSQQANVFRREWFTYGNWGLSLQVPLFDSYKKAAQFQQKKLDQQKIMNNIKAFESTARLDVENKLQAHITAWENYKNQKMNYALAEKIYKTTRLKYHSGVGNSVELAQAEAAYAEAQSQYLQSIFDVLSSKVDLDKALGKIK
jgi:outer membrane protein TolC